MDVKIVCPSRLRARDVLTTQYIPDLIFIVRKEEVEEYSEWNPDQEVIGTPEDVNNIAKTRQWILENFSEDNVFMVDDDVCSIRRTYAERGERSDIYDVKLINDLIGEHAYICKQIGAYMWGYQSIRNPNEYISHRPYRLTGYLNNSHVGFLKGHGLNYALDYGEAEDYYISLLNYYEHRYAFIDTRFTFITKDNFLADGGVNDIRTVDMMKSNTIKLRKVFGEAVVLKKPTANKKRLHEGERSLRFRL